MRRMIRTTVLAVLLSVPVSGVALAQSAPSTASGTASGSGTLADLRTQLKTLAADLQSLRNELQASGQVGYLVAGGDAAIDRMNAMETQIAALTGQAEQLQNRINRVVADGTNRLGDMEFRLCEMDESCNLATLTSPPPLGESGGGGATLPVPSAPRPVPTDNTSATTGSEQADFDRAREVLGQGDFHGAAELFAAIAETYAGGPLTAEALYLRGQALDSAGDPKGAAAAWLEGFAADPENPRAAESLLGLARIIADEGDALASCLYLSEIPVRFAGSAAAQTAVNRMTELDCGREVLLLPPDDSDGLDPEQAADMTAHE